MSSLKLHLARDATTRDLLAVLLAAGASSARIGRAVAALDVGASFDDSVDDVRGGEGVLVRPGDVDALLERPGVSPRAALLTSEAIARLLLDEAEGRSDRFVVQRLDAPALARALACATALLDLTEDEVEVSRPNMHGDALLRALLVTTAHADYR